MAASGSDLIAVGDDRPPLVVLREQPELIGEIGDVDLALPQHAA